MTRRRARNRHSCGYRSLTVPPGRKGGTGGTPVTS
jgi:hypothetical protein